MEFSSAICFLQAALIGSSNTTNAWARSWSIAEKAASQSGEGPLTRMICGCSANFCAASRFEFERHSAAFADAAEACGYFETGAQRRPIGPFELRSLHRPIGEVGLWAWLGGNQPQIVIVAARQEQESRRAGAHPAPTSLFVICCSIAFCHACAAVRASRAQHSGESPQVSCPRCTI
jgi:hypothetical protein